MQEGLERRRAELAALEARLAGLGAAEQKVVAMQAELAEQQRQVTTGPAAQPSGTLRGWSTPPRPAPPRRAVARRPGAWEGGRAAPFLRRARAGVGSEAGLCRGRRRRPRRTSGRGRSGCCARRASSARASRPGPASGERRERLRERRARFRGTFPAARGVPRVSGRGEQRWGRGGVAGGAAARRVAAARKMGRNARAAAAAAVC